MLYTLRAALLLGLMVFALFGCGRSTTEPETPDESVAEPRAIPADLQKAVERSEAFGRLIYLQDAASAVGTDALFAHVPDAENLGLGGYVTVPDADSNGKPDGSYNVFFFTTEAEPRIAYAIDVSLSAVEQAHVRKNEPPEVPSEWLRLLIRARQTALRALKHAVQPINPIVLPAAAAGERGFWVYLLAATRQPKVAVLGRHYRVWVSPDGRSVRRFEPLSKSIMELSLEPPDMPKGAKLDSLIITHLVTDYPLETHVFVNMLHNKPLFIVTRRGLWRVAQGRIAFLGEP